MIRKYKCGIRYELTIISNSYIWKISIYMHTIREALVHTYMTDMRCLSTQTIYHQSGEYIYDSAQTNHIHCNINSI